MGLFFNRKKKAQQIEVAKEELVQALAHEMLTQTIGPEPTQERLAELEERERLAEEGRKIRKERIAEQGVDVDMFTTDKVAADALVFLDSFAPAYRKLSLQVENANVNGDFQNLTKTGKLPKNVFYGTFDLYEFGTDDSIIVHIKYLASGAVNMVDLHLWHNHVRHGMSIRTVDGDYRITCITSTDLRRDVETTLYLENKPADNAAALAVFADAMDGVLA